MMSIRGNSGFIDIDKRFGSGINNVKGVISREQHFLETTNGRFTPPTLSPTDPTVWYDAQYVTLDTNNTNVIELLDRSGNGIDADTSSTSTPLYTLSDSTFNGYPSLDFQEDHNMESSDTNLLNCSNGFTMYMVLQVKDITDTFSFLAGFTNGETWNQGWGMLYYSGNWRFFVNSWNTTSNRVNLGSWSDLTNAHIFKFRYDRTNLLGEIIGPSSVGETTSPFTPSVTNPTGEGIRLGDGNSNTFQIGAKISEYLYYNSPLTSEEQNKTESYLKDKFNIN